jgi:hypothetical protein
MDGWADYKGRQKLQDPSACSKSTRIGASRDVAEENVKASIISEMAAAGMRSRTSWFERRRGPHSRDSRDNGRRRRPTPMKLSAASAKIAAGMANVIATITG